MLNILFVHQSAEMYGSDKVLLSLVKGLDNNRFRPVVLLPGEGPLLVALKASGIEVHIVPVIKISRATLSLAGLVRLPWQIWCSLAAMNRALDRANISIVHSNTLAVLSGALWAKLHRLPHVWHVHEMIIRPKIVREGFPWLLRVFADQVICNSRPTEDLLLESQPTLKEKSTTIWNGMDRVTLPDADAARRFRYNINVDAESVLVVLMGRINRWKGQGLLIQAAALLKDRGLNQVRYLIVGSPPEGQLHFLDELKESLVQSGVGEFFCLLDVQQDIWPIWDAADIAVVPSTEPEPFGMVALEAMAAAKPIVAAAHGGLLDIIVDGETGVLVTPNDPESLAVAIAALVTDLPMRRRMGQEGRRRLEEHFSLKSYVKGFEKIYEKIITSSSSSHI